MKDFFFFFSELEERSGMHCGKQKMCAPFFPRNNQVKALGLENNMYAMYSSLPLTIIFGMHCAQREVDEATIIPG